MDVSVAERIILVVQDNPEHTRLIRDAFAESPVPHQVIAIAHGHEVMDFLHHRGEYTNAPRPDLILLELNLPDRDGREILADVKADPQLRRIPIVVLTVSNLDDDVFRTYALQGNCYVIKSADMNQLAQIVKRIEAFWLGIVTLPVE